MDHTCRAGERAFELVSRVARASTFDRGSFQLVSAKNARRGAHTDRLFCKLRLHFARSSRQPIEMAVHRPLTRPERGILLRSSRRKVIGKPFVAKDEADNANSSSESRSRG